MYRKIRPDILITFWLTYYPRTEIIEIARGTGILNDKEIEEIENGFVGYTHGEGSVPKETIPLMINYELKMVLSPLVRNNRLFSLLSKMLPYIYRLNDY